MKQAQVATQEAAQEEHTIVVRRTIRATAEELFDAWMDPAAMSAWMHPGRCTKDSDVTIDARVDGAYEIIMHNVDGPIPHHGVYRVIDRPRRVAFSWNSPYTNGRETEVTVDFLRAGTAAAPATEVIITHSGLPTASLATGHNKGWSDAIESLQNYATRK